MSEPQIFNRFACQSCAEKSVEIARLVVDLRYVQGIVERGENRILAGNEPVTESILAYVKKLEALQAATRRVVEALEDIASGELGINVSIKRAKVALADPVIVALRRE
jgi:hypothetical protein